MIDDFRYERGLYGSRMISFGDAVGDDVIVEEMLGRDSDCIYIKGDVKGALLTRTQARELAKILKYFSKTGRLPDEKDVK